LCDICVMFRLTKISRHAYLDVCVCSRESGYYQGKPSYRMKVEVYRHYLGDFLSVHTCNCTHAYYILMHEIRGC